MMTENLENTPSVKQGFPNLIREGGRTVGSGRITTSIIRHALNECFAAANVNTAGKKHGPHAFRSSLASSMVNDNASYEVVRRILGHSNPDVIKHYAKADIENLRMCSIDPPIPTGIFHDYPHTSHTEI